MPVAALAAALAALQYWLLPSDEDGRRGVVEFLGLFAFFALALSWLWTSGPLVPHLFPPPPDPSALALRAGLTLAVGACSFLVAARRPRWLGIGAAAGALAAWCGFFAGRWLVICHAWAMLGWFSGPFLRAVMPALLASSLAAGCLVLQVEDLKPSRAAVLALLFAVWGLSARTALWRLTTSYGFGPRDLSSAAAVPGALAAPLVGTAWLRPSTTTAAGYVVETRRASVDTVDAQGESLIKLYAYLRDRDYRSVFGREALGALRRGWLLWWDADRALESQMLARPGRAAPDYLGALALLRAGPLTIERFQKLRALNEVGRDRKAGFEDVNRSQLIFEAFSAAYARFGDEQGAREWLYKVDNLWPIYEKRVEVSPVESFHDGEISGSLEAVGRQPSSLLVGLFLVSTSSAATVARSTPTLSSSDFPREDGRFEFRDLGPGTYMLGLEGSPEAFRGAIEGSPGYIAIGASTPTAHLDPIRVLP